MSDINWHIYTQNSYTSMYINIYIMFKYYAEKKNQWVIKKKIKKDRENSLQYTKL